MKNFILIIALMFSLNAGFSQITILSSDIGEEGDTTRYSNSTMPIADITATAADHVWDFTSMVATSQNTDEYIDYSDANIIYTIAFLGKADMASPRADMAIMGIGITNSYNFYKKSTNSFKKVGNAGEVNGTPLPMVYDSPDVIYRFPMDYGNIDSSDSHFAMSLPSMGYLEEDLHRVNTVDGWGTLKTPHGVYQCLRVKSHVIQSDSAFMTSSGMGMRIPQEYTEYIWLAKSKSFPIAVATVSILGSSIKYMDSYIPFAGINDSKDVKVKMTIQPNPATNNVFITLKATTDRSNLVISDITGKEVLKKSFTNNTNVDISGFAKGVYIINILNDNNTYSEKLIVK